MVIIGGGLGRGLGGAINPFGGAIGVVLLFPDGQAELQLLNHMPAGGKTGLTVRGGDADPDRRLADGKYAGAMHAQDFGARINPLGLAHDGLAFEARHVVEGLVLQFRDRLAEVMVAHAPFENCQGSRFGRAEPRLQGGGVDGAVGELKHAQPPATGGMNTTRSPAASGVDRST